MRSSRSSATKLATERESPQTITKCAQKHNESHSGTACTNRETDTVVFMLAVELLTPWQEKDRHWAALADDYSKRLNKKWRFTETVIASNANGKNSRKAPTKKKRQQHNCQRSS